MVVPSRNVTSDSELEIKEIFRDYNNDAQTSNENEKSEEMLEETSDEKLLAVNEEKVCVTHKSAYYRLKKRLEKIEEDNFAIKMNLACKKAEDKFEITCHFCERTVTTTAKRGVIPIEDHLNTWNHIDRANNTNGERASQVYREVEEKHSGVFFEKQQVSLQRLWYFHCCRCHVKRIPNFTM